MRRWASSPAKSPEQKFAPLSVITASTGMSLDQNQSWALRQNWTRVAAVSSLRASTSATRPDSLARRFGAISATGPASWCTSTSRNWRGSPDSNGWRLHGKGNAAPRAGVRYRYIHTAIDDRTRIAYSEIHATNAPSPPRGVLEAAHRNFAAIGVTAAPALPAPDQQQSRTLPPHTPRRIGLQTALTLRNPTPRRLPRIHPLLQSPPIPRRAQLGHTNPNPQPTKQGQPPRRPKLACDIEPPVLVGWYTTTLAQEVHSITLLPPSIPRTTSRSVNHRSASYHCSG